MCSSSPASLPLLELFPPWLWLSRPFAMFCRSVTSEAVQRLFAPRRAAVVVDLVSDQDATSEVAATEEEAPSEVSATLAADEVALAAAGRRAPSPELHLRDVPLTERAAKSRRLATSPPPVEGAAGPAASAGPAAVSCSSPHSPEAPALSPSWIAPRGRDARAAFSEDQLASAVGGRIREKFGPAAFAALCAAADLSGDEFGVVVPREQTMAVERVLRACGGSASSSLEVPPVWKCTALHGAAAGLAERCRTGLSDDPISSVEDSP